MVIKLFDKVRLSFLGTLCSLSSIECSLSSDFKVIYSDICLYPFGELFLQMTSSCMWLKGCFGASLLLFDLPWQKEHSGLFCTSRFQIPWHDIFFNMTFLPVFSWYQDADITYHNFIIQLSWHWIHHFTICLHY